MEFTQRMRLSWESSRIICVLDKGSPLQSLLKQTVSLPRSVGEVLVGADSISWARRFIDHLSIWNMAVNVLRDTTRAGLMALKRFFENACQFGDGLRIPSGPFRWHFFVGGVGCF